MNSMRSTVCIKVIGLFFCVSLLVLACRNTQDKTYKGPHISFDKTEYDLGRIGQNGEYTFSFKYTNTGSDTLNILDVKSGCGCTVVEQGKDTLEPGESSEIKGTFHSGQYKGRLVRAISVKSNDPDNSEIILYINSIIEVSKQ
jgi:hypothetical protein